MKYKVTRESSLLNIDWDTIKDRIKRPVETLRHRHDQLYFDTQDIWVWHNDKRKKIPLRHIQSAAKATLHGFGQMIKLTYLRKHAIEEDGKMVTVQLVNVDQMDKSPEEISKDINDQLEVIRKQDKNELRPFRFSKN